MKRLLTSLVLVAVATLPARAHFVWLLPSTDPAKPGVRMVFSDDLQPDSEELLDRLKGTEVFVAAEDKVIPVKFAKVGDALVPELPGGRGHVVAAACTYGVTKRGEMPPFLLTYYAKTWTGEPGRNMDALMRSVAEKLDLDIRKAGAGKLAVVWKGKPVAGAEVVLTVPGQDRPVKATTAEDGSFELTLPTKPGLYGIRARHVVKEEGKHDGKEYKEKRYYTTLVFDTRPLQAEPKRSEPRDDKAGDSAVLAEKKERKEDPEATKLLADARAARANWEDFPGFTADLEVNVDGKVTKARLDVDARGKVTLSGIGDPRLEEQTRRQLASVVGHRLDSSGDLKTPCAFADDVADHPLGRAITVLNDEFHSSYRIRDRQVIVVNRSMKDIRFTITVLENKLTTEKQFIPAHYVVNSWDLKTSELRRSESFHHDWVRLGKYDLPASTMVVTATTDGKLEARQMKLTNHKLR